MMPEFWLPLMSSRPSQVGHEARKIESDGWDGVCIGDTQCLLGDAFVVMTAAAAATSRLRLTLSTSNPVTRHPAVAASAIASVRDIAGNRVRYGIGRGDSAIAHVGGAPASVRTLEAYVDAVHRYLHRESVPHESIRDWRLTRSVSTVGLGHEPPDSRLMWLPPEHSPVPIDVYATGPRVLGIAGRSADGVVLGVGSDVNRIRWAMGEAGGAAEAVGRAATSLPFATVSLIGVSNSMAQARQLVSNVVALSARFTAMSGKVVGPATAEQERVYHDIARSYDMMRHGGSGAQVDVLTDEFIDSYAVVGSRSRCVERILELIELGVSRFIFGPVSAGDTDAASLAQYEELIGYVIPEVRSQIGQRVAG
jgi:5,10-methylenetetrahydromethanopterin reductase